LTKTQDNINSISVLTQSRHKTCWTHTKTGTEIHRWQPDDWNVTSSTAVQHV